MDAPRVLFLQNQLCGRSWRAAKVLADAGRPVFLFEVGEPSPQLDYDVFAERIHLRLPRDIRSMLLRRRTIVRALRAAVRTHRIDLVHAHNTPDNLSVWAERALDVPVIHDVHDLQSTIPIRYGSLITRPILRALYDRWEAVACRDAAAVVVVSEEQRDHIAARYAPRRLLVIPNKAVQPPATPRRKLSADGGIHIVYAGTFSLAPGSHRNFLAEMKALATDDVHVHVYPLTFDAAEQQKVVAALADHPNLHYHEPVPTTRLVEELAVYDWGWLHFPVLTDNIRMASATKLFEYVLAGLPSIVNPEGRIAEFVRRTGCGILVDDIRAARPYLHDPNGYPMPVEECVLQADELSTLYRDVL